MRGWILDGYIRQKDWCSKQQTPFKLHMSSSSQNLSESFQWSNTYWIRADQAQKQRNYSFETNLELITSRITRNCSTILCHEIILAHQLCTGDYFYEWKENSTMFYGRWVKAQDQFLLTPRTIAKWVQITDKLESFCFGDSYSLSLIIWLSLMDQWFTALAIIFHQLKYIDKHKSGNISKSW